MNIPVPWILRVIVMCPFLHVLWRESRNLWTKWSCAHGFCLSLGPVRTCWEWRVWGCVKFTVECMDCKGSHLKGCFWWLMWSPKTSLFQLLLCFLWETPSFTCVFTQLPILNEVSPCFQDPFRWGVLRWCWCFQSLAMEKILARWIFTPLCLLFPQSWGQWKISKLISETSYFHPFSTSSMITSWPISS